MKPDLIAKERAFLEETGFGEGKREEARAFYAPLKGASGLVVVAAAMRSRGPEL